MHIGIDGNEANIENKVGIGQFAFQLLTRLHKIDKKNRYTIYLSSKPNKDLPVETKNWKYKVIGPKKFWTQWRLPLELYTTSDRPDIFFSPSHYSPRFSPIPTVCSIMDLSYIHTPREFTKKDFYQLKNWTSYSVKKATQIITISNFTKKEIQKYYKVPAGKITVAHLAADQPPQGLSLKALEKFKIKKPYFLCLGTLKPNKNIPLLIRSFALFLKHQSSKALKPRLVIAGKKGWLYHDIFRTVQELKLQDSVIFTDFITETEKWSLLKNTQAFLLPSLYEGFGIPVLEAMSIGTPVICSNTTSLPEVAGESGLTINPESEKELTRAMIKITDPKIHQKYKKLGPKQAGKFSWTKTTQIVLKTLENLLEN